MIKINNYRIKKNYNYYLPTLITFNLKKKIIIYYSFTLVHPKINHKKYIIS